MVRRIIDDLPDIGSEALVVWDRARYLLAKKTHQNTETLRVSIEETFFSHSAHYETYIGISPYRTLAVVELQSIWQLYIICDLIVWENTNVVHFSCDMGKYSTCPHLILWTSAVFSHIALKWTLFAYHLFDTSMPEQGRAQHYRPRPRSLCYAARQHIMQIRHWNQSKIKKADALIQ